ncbi:GPI-GlcNAc transferase complex [Lasiosphaeria ovina]|uniref:GPI-GlcNAc transferase complex n=1 Tax=Lasiosphaeria ovina TaxID=92902 RepID=A0AAE0K834_9PEZI|nr:GPI-GlcNAc transferase complex [Lasiosphaeria ovina]
MFFLTTPAHLYIRRPSPTTAEFTVTTCPPLTVPLRVALFSVLCVRVALVVGVVLTAYARLSPSPSSNPSSPSSTPSSSSSSSSSSPFLPFSSWDAVALLLQRWLDWLLASAAGQQCAALAAAQVLRPWWALGGVCGAAGWAAAALGRIHTTESLLVLRGLGIQTASSYGTFSHSGGSDGDCDVGYGGWWWFFGWLLQLALGTRSAQGSLGGGGSGGSAMATTRETRFIPTEKIRDVLINEAFRGLEVRYCLVVVVDGEEDVVVVFPRLLPPRRIVEAVWRGVRGCLYEPDGGGSGGGTGMRQAAAGEKG